jgi:type IV pilus assembly protein PilY1
MFTAVGPTGLPQPITSAPVAVPNPYGQGGFLVAFGTGKNLTDADTTDSNLNSMYGVYDSQPINVGPATGSQLSQILLGNSTAAAGTTVSPSPIPTSCLSGTGPGRYSGCLYQQTGGAMSTGTTKTATDSSGNSVTVTSNASSNTVDSSAINSTEPGWYYDIPEVANGNAAKVLANPFMMDGNTLVFYSENVASSSSGTNASSSTTESCDSTMASGAITTLNYFNVLTGNYPDNTITIGNQTYPAGQGNRFQINGVVIYLQNNSNSVNPVQPGTWGGSINSTPIAVTPGKIVGWRIMQ